MSLSRRSRLLVGLVAVLIATVLAVWGWGHARGDGNGWVEVSRGDLILGVEVTGALKALDSVTVGPPQVPEVWEFKIASMAPEGKRVRAGEPVLGFDTSQLDQQLREKANARDAAREEIKNRRANLELERETDALRLATAEANLRKARLKLERPDDLVASKEIAKTKLDLDLYEREVAYLKDRKVKADLAAAAGIAGLEDTERRAAMRVQQIELAIGAMQVAAPRDGTVTYISNWREEKKKPGDTCWRGERLLELPDLATMVAQGEVDEGEAGRVAVGQRVTFRLDAHPDHEVTGKVTAVTRAVERKAAQSQLKVVRMTITLDRTDAEKMRPGMRFRGTIEVGRVAGALVVPLEAISLTARGPALVRRSVTGSSVVAVELGPRNDTQVEIRAGVGVGDQVARRFPAEAK
jgi:HlyD family secretion protein